MDDLDHDVSSIFSTCPKVSEVDLSQCTLLIQDADRCVLFIERILIHILNANEDYNFNFKYYEEKCVLLVFFF